jgi:hypothetical protein
MPNWPGAKLGDTVIGLDLHVAARNLHRLGVSLLGAQQFLKGEAVLLQNDRLVLSRIVLQGLGDEARPHDAITQLQMRWGVSLWGARQFVAAEIVTDKADRVILAGQATSHAVGMHEITGAIVKIN